MWFALHYNKYLNMCNNGHKLVAFNDNDNMERFYMESVIIRLQIDMYNNILVNFSHFLLTFLQ